MKTMKETESKGYVDPERKASNTKLDALGEETVN